MTPLQYPFMVRSMVAVILVGIVCSTVGVFVVLRGMAFFGDAVAHAVLPGVAAGYMIGGGARGPVFWCALAVAILVSTGIGAIAKGSRIKEDTAIGIIFAGMFALGIALISSMQHYAVDLTHFLFGNVLGVSEEDLLLTGVFGGIVVLTVLAFYKEFLVITFDSNLATTLRLPAKRLYYVLLILIGVTIVVSLQTVGVALMLAMLVTPAATAQCLTRRLPVMIFLACLVGTLSGVVGLYVSYYAGIASGAAIVLVCTGFFLVSFAVSRVRGF